MLEITVFICGAVVMILELTGSRIMAPFLGTSLVVWTGLIGVVLAALSLGYWWGGRLADRNPSMSRLAWIVFSAGALIALIALIQAPILRLLQAHVSNLHLGVLLGTVILFAPASILLGMIAPFAVKMKLASLEQSGAVVGRMYALSTIGSIVGTFMAGFVLLSFFGSLSILLFLGGVMTLLAMALAPRSGLAVKSAFLVLVVLGAMLHVQHRQALAERGFIDMDTTYNRIIVARAVEESTGRQLQVMSTGPGWLQSAMYLDDPFELTLPYTRFFRLAEVYVPAFRRVLMVGGGGYSFPKFLMQTRPDLELDVVEIDPAFTALAKSYFHFSPDDRVAVHHLDARRYLNQVHQPYDVIILDAFNSHYSIPYQLTTRQAMQRIAANMDDNGVVLVNLISAVSGDQGRFLRALLATMESVFVQVNVYPVTEPDNDALVQNIVLAARKIPDTTTPALNDNNGLSDIIASRWTHPIPRDLPLLTDALAPVERYLP
ncbi:Spermidine synthase [Desulfonatronum thiosulfatophilum]|uniref:Spermidine synthase n=1 Tax=Desulfonatronum thiosulfatophilum TaxID=617002 RepID=A0A1G6A0W6_9BACT|nr:fused MFS/spermidine synthase [Desulfonatronum thiosulfatophilum]SDB02062.1 Spermidine synthase [Desulfonatronum thiosulfatophilum]